MPGTAVPAQRGLARKENDPVETDTRLLPVDWENQGETSEYI